VRKLRPIDELMMTQPPLGTKCSDCGCCNANIAVGDGSALCWECDAGEQCKGNEALGTPLQAAATNRSHDNLGLD
jgi:hypothetical protein